jgi:Fic-DOC domain mobile mystery protein B
MDISYPDGATPIDPDDKEGLKLPHITTREELNAWEQRNITEAYEWLQQRRNPQILSEQFIRSLHEKMFDKVWKWAGDFRRSNKNIGVEWTQIPIHLRQLLEDVEFWIEQKTYLSDEIATRLHHRLVQVHLFPNGNGRHARLITDYLLEEKFKKQAFTWGSGNLFNLSEVRSDYINCLRAADKNKYQPLLEFIRS